jgi:vacuolar-type H+-ATPase subunit I/STV1
MTPKREKLLQEQAQKFKMRKDKLEYLDYLNKKATPGPWIPMDLGQGLKRDADITLLVELRNNAEALIDSAQGQLWTEEWYAARIEMLRDLCEKHGLLTEFCNIAANGKESASSPPTYQQQMNLLKFAKEKAEDALQKTCKNMERMETDLYLNLNDKEKEIESLRDLLHDCADHLEEQFDAEDNLAMMKKIRLALDSKFKE